MPQIPVVCQHCGDTFGSGVELGPGSTVLMAGNKFGCPSCGGLATIPDGIYEVVADVMALTQRPLDRHRLDSWRRDLLAAGGYARGSAHTTLENVVSSAPTELRPLAQKVAESPKWTPQEKVATLLTVVGILLNLMLTGGPSTTINTDQSRDTTITHVGDDIKQEAPEQPNQLCHCGSGKQLSDCHGG